MRPNFSSQLKCEVHVAKLEYPSGHCQLELLPVGNIIY